LRRRSARRALSQLHRRTGAPADPANRPAAAPSGVDAPDLQAGRMCPDVTLRASRRGLVPPFIAMDVLRAANEREAAGADVIQLAFLAAFEAGHRVGLAVPGYPAYRNILTALDIEPVLIEVGENAHYQSTPELLADAGRLDGLIIASPANPTGTMIGAGDLSRLAGYCDDHGIRLISDEIYHGI